MGGVPSIPTDPSRKLHVIGAGYSRTGTVTMQLALEKLLDGPVMHGGTHILSREDAFTKKWVAAYQAKRAGDGPRTRKLIRELMAGYVGCTDMPPLNFLPELMDVYPDARVVLVTRDPERWLDSIRPIARNTSLWWLPYAMWPVPGWRWFPALTVEFGKSGREILDVAPGVKPGLTSRLLTDWNDKVKEMVPKDKLLVMDLKEGWQPLCDFLGVPVPDEPFPRANDSAAAEKTAKDVAKSLLLVWAGMFSVAGIVAFGAWRCLL
ncbi:P-loop containing nucleoside triphosphate hydrolase protein [Diplogelasinospora grovesii]|uniref:P-loop containing nucleoside triphosphate hydrolase protein n=1 Tax=Diplogelasinospora grovesii TaxID=303347 RepID=A0AAN6NGV3_9PEZI|nr:P-loop containing nucleoside triphosphate hydrolase protein [Diplogelasinospora grovesii]